MKVLWICAVLVCAVTSQAPHLSKEVKHNSLNLKTLHLQAEGAKITWQALRGSHDFVLRHREDLTVDVREEDDKLHVFIGDYSQGKASTFSASAALLLTSAMALCFTSKRSAAVAMVAASVVASARGGLPMADSDVHLLIPADFIEQMCVNGECQRVLCRLSPHSDYSDVPSNNEVVFEDNHCTIRKPDRWDEWVEHYFGKGSTQGYYGDVDGDGLVNILEYHGEAAFDGAFVTDSTVVSRKKRQLGGFFGTNPVKADSDGDLLQDGFELISKLNPWFFDLITGDYDNDKLDNLLEQIFGTDPNNPDSDGDGVPDGEEVDNNGDPTNPSDNGQAPVSQSANVNTTVGDHSGSNSERYILRVGHIEHQSPTFGQVGSGIYNFLPGSYRITMQHYGTNLSSGIPDYDYTMLVFKVDGDAQVTVDDPNGIMGKHLESSYLYADGKYATLIVSANCPAGSAGEECECARLLSCDQCTRHEKCDWNFNNLACVRKSSAYAGRVSTPEECPCHQCREWYDVERQDTAWVDQQNADFPCPCSVTVGQFEVVPTDPAEVGRWRTDPSCGAHGKPRCEEFHTNATGCLRFASDISGPRQQCCYGEDGALLPPDAPGAGTPDKGGPFEEHRDLDIIPNRQCCSQCEDDSHCGLFQQIRRGDDSHCP